MQNMLTLYPYIPEIKLGTFHLITLTIFVFLKHVLCVLLKKMMYNECIIYYITVNYLFIFDFVY